MLRRVIWLKMMILGVFENLKFFGIFFVDSFYICSRMPSTVVEVEVERRPI